MVWLVIVIGLFSPERRGVGEREFENFRRDRDIDINTNAKVGVTNFSIIIASTIIIIIISTMIITIIIIM